MSNMGFSTKSVSSVPKVIVYNFCGKKISIIAERSRQKRSTIFKGTFMMLFFGERVQMQKYKGKIKTEGNVNWSQWKRQAPHVLTFHIKKKHTVEQQWSCTAE